MSRFTQLTGICRHAVNHAKALSDLSDISRITLLVGSWQRDYFREALGWNPKVRIAAAECSNNSISRNMWYARALPQLCSELNATIVHLAYPVPFSRRRFPVPVATTIHDLYPLDCPGNFGYPGVLFNRAFLRRCVHESDALTCVSEFTRSRLRHYFPGSVSRKVVITAPSYSEMRHTPPSRPPDAPERFILAVGQHRQNKKLDLVIRAYANVIRSGVAASHLRLVLAGAPGPETLKLHSLVRALALDQHVLFMQELTDANLAWLYRHCEVFVAASSIEGFCLPLLEASELAQRIVCSDIPVFREVAPANSSFFSLQDRADVSLSRTLADALNSAPRHISGWQSTFTRHRASREYESLYSQLIGTQSICTPTGVVA